MDGAPQAPALHLGPRSPSALMSKMQVQVGAEGDLVTLQIGNVSMKMSYEAALQLSQWLRVRAKQAKRAAGDQSRHWSAIAVLDGLHV